jgi:hypothetical protein
MGVPSTFVHVNQQTHEHPYAIIPFLTCNKI